ncbi:MAG: YqiJ family protein, partial [Proteobacteria bacterium]|nr:YqiJ family protein [Pseudomonadota bacterium]
FTAIQILGKTIPSLIASVPAVMCALPTVRVCGGLLGKYMPKDETYVVSEKSFLGQIATITMGTARDNNPAQAKLKDQHGQTHYILVVPDNPAASFQQGDKTIIVSQNGSIFKVIANTSSVLTD